MDASTVASFMTVLKSKSPGDLPSSSSSSSASSSSSTAERVEKCGNSGGSGSRDTPSGTNSAFSDPPSDGHNQSHNNGNTLESLVGEDLPVVMDNRNSGGGRIMTSWAQRMHRRAATLGNVVTSCGHPSAPYPRRIEKY